MKPFCSYPHFLHLDCGVNQVGLTHSHRNGLQAPEPSFSSIIISISILASYCSHCESIWKQLYERRLLQFESSIQQCCTRSCIEKVLEMSLPVTEPRACSSKSWSVFYCHCSDLCVCGDVVYIEFSSFVKAVSKSVQMDTRGRPNLVDRQVMHFPLHKFTDMKVHRLAFPHTELEREGGRTTRNPCTASSANCLWQ